MSASHHGLSWLIAEDCRRSCTIMEDCAGSLRRLTEYHKCEVRWCLENAGELLNACGIGILQTPPVDCLEI